MLSGASFLTLPPALRRRIYYEAGLASCHYINLNQSASYRLFPGDWSRTGGVESDHEAEYVDDYSQNPLSLSYNLFQVSRIVYAETSSIVYSENAFLIRYKDSRNLQALHSLTPGTLGHLTHLTIILNVDSQEITKTPLPSGICEFQVGNKDHRPLGMVSRADKSIISHWKRAATLLATYSPPFQLSLYFVCDARDCETAKRVLEPLLHMSRLKECAIRLGREPNRGLQRLAEEAVARATHNWAHHSCTTFRFLDLPKEIRLQILEYTDLVTPLREIEYQPGECFHLGYSTEKCRRDACPERLHHACRFRRCVNNASEGCYCRRYHSAYYSKCECWTPPTYLFLVCRMMRDDALEVFFSQNHFVVKPLGDCHEPAERTPERIGPSIFLSDIVPFNALRFLRSIEFVFPPFELDYLRPHENASKDWLRTIDHMAKTGCIQRLRISVHMAGVLAKWDMRRRAYVPYRFNLRREHGEAILDMYSRTIRPLAKLDGLRDLFVHLIWPWSYHGARGREKDFYAREERMAEWNIEKYVMGDSYDSISRGKKDQRQSQWLERYNDIMKSSL